MITKITIRELIEKLEYIEEIVKHSPHPNTDLVDITVHFGDMELDSKDWNVAIDEITFNNRIGCGCEQDCVIQLDIREDK